jgi:endonuclease III
MTRAGKKLRSILSRLDQVFGPVKPPPVKGTFEMILWENVAYLVSDERREAAFRTLQKLTGTKPKEILVAPREAILAATRLGGMHPEDRVRRLRDIAALAVSEFEGDDEVLLRMPPAKARRVLKKFPSIGGPGADKILLFSGAQPVFALESNGLRALLRLGYGVEKKNYDATYRSVLEAVRGELPEDRDELIRAHLLLRRHGQEICRRSEPLCDVCPVSSGCRYYREHRRGAPRRT